MNFFKTILLSSIAIGAMTSFTSAFAETPAADAPKIEATKVADMSSFSDAQKAALEDYVRSFILNNPEVLMESVNRFREKTAAKENDGAKDNLKTQADNIYKGGHPEIGNPKGDITIVEFFDYNCGYCKRAFETVAKTIENDKNIRVILIDLPILSPASSDAAKWALAASKQGKYWEFHKALLTSNAPKDEENMLTLAKAIGLDIEKLKKDASDKSIEEALKKNSEIARALNVTGTPGFIIGENILRGFVEYEGFKGIIDLERKSQKK